MQGISHVGVRLMSRMEFLLGLFLVVSSLSAPKAISQDFSISLSTPYKSILADSKLHFSDGKGYIYSVKTNEIRVAIQKFDVNTMQEVGRADYRDVPSNIKAIDIVEIAGKFFYVFEYRDFRDKNLVVYSREFNTQNCTLGEQKLLLETGGPVANGPIWAINPVCGQ